MVFIIKDFFFPPPRLNIISYCSSKKRQQKEQAFAHREGHFSFLNARFRFVRWNGASLCVELLSGIKWHARGGRCIWLIRKYTLLKHSTMVHHGSFLLHLWNHCDISPLFINLILQVLWWETHTLLALIRLSPVDRRRLWLQRNFRKKLWLSVHLVYGWLQPRAL